MNLQKIVFFFTSLIVFHNMLHAQESKSSSKENDHPVFSQSSFREYCSYIGFNPDVASKKELRHEKDRFGGIVAACQYAWTKPDQYKEEIRTMKASLMKAYMDSVRVYQYVSNQEIREAYRRYSNLREVSHIQVNLPEILFPLDTIQAYNKINEIIAELQGGKPFEAVAVKYSENYLTVNDSGYIGICTFNSLTYPLELMAFNTPAGSYSRPFKTWPGYQIVKVHSERPSRGLIYISHIAMSLKGENNEDLSEMKIKAMKEIHSRIIKGESFDDLARAYSEDTYTAVQGGTIGYISEGFQSREIAGAAFNLTKNGEVSDLVLTPNTVHILKRIGYRGIADFESVKDSLKQQLIANQARQEFLKEQFNKDLKTRAGYVSYPANVQAYLLLGGTCLQKGRWVTPPDSVLNKVLFRIGATSYTYKDLSARMERGNYPYRIANYRPMIWKYFLEFEEEILSASLKENFEELYPEYALKAKWNLLISLSKKVEEQELIKKLSYGQEELEALYQKNKRKYVDSDGAIQNFDQAFPSVLLDYQRLKADEWRKSLMKARGINPKKIENRQ